MYVADTGNNTIRKITPAGVVTTFAGAAGVAGSADGIGTAAQFSGPVALTTDSSGNVYVADEQNFTIRKITPAGVVTTFAGTAGLFGSTDGTGAAARFESLNAVASDSTGNVYVAEFYTIRKITPSGVVTTFAGAAGLSGNTDGTGAAARFYGAYGVATDSSGNVYVADANNNAIRKITPDGVVSTFGPGYPQVNSPRGLATDNSGNVYVSDYSERVLKITPGGVVSALAGSAYVLGSTDGTGTAAQFNSPDGVATDGSGNVYVADAGNSAIRKISSVGAVTTFAGLASSGSTDGTGAAARFNGPEPLTTDSAGNIYVGEYYNNTIRKITPAGVVTTFAGTAGLTGSTDGTGAAARFYEPRGVAADNSGNVYVADSSNQTIRKITPAGVVTTFAGTAGASGSADGTGAAARFYYPEGVATDLSGNVYVSDYGNYTIRKITPAGVVTTLAGTAGLTGTTDGTGAAARFGTVWGLAVDSSGNVYVSDYDNFTIRKITPAGVVTTFAGTAGVAGSADGTGAAAQFYYAIGVATDSSGNVYVADTGSQTIRKITPAGVVTTVAGLANVAGNIDGTGPAARFSSPIGIAVDGSGIVYVAGNNTIRKSAAPMIASISPNSGPNFGGQSVTITGKNLSSASVTIGGSAASVTGTTATTATFTTPAHAAGVADVMVTTAVGGTDISTGVYTFTTPTITNISPGAGPLGGGQSVTITGTSLNGASVTIGGNGATVTGTTATTATFNTPAHAAGAVDVTVTTTTGSATSTGGYTYVAAPTITNINPSAGPLGGGQSVTITGTNLSGASVTIGGNGATVTGTTATTATFTTPAHAGGVVNVVVTTVGGNATSISGYTYAGPPTITNISPAVGPVAGGQSVTITGTNLSGASVTISTPITNGGFETGDFSGWTPSGITAVNGAANHSGTWGAQVGSTGASTDSSISQTFTLATGNPTISFWYANTCFDSVTFDWATATLTDNVTLATTTLLPHTCTGSPVWTQVSFDASANAGHSVTLTLANHDDNLAADPTYTYFDNVAATTTATATVTGTTATTATFTTPPHAAGPVDVTVTTASGSATSTGGYTYITPTITNISPSAGPTAGGQSVTITGTNLSGASVTIGGNTATVTGTTSTTATFNTPAHAEGIVDVVAATANGSVTSTGGYVYAGPPAITNFTPNAGSVAGGQLVTITGMRLFGASITIGGSAAIVTSMTATTASFTTPPHAPGVVDVLVTTPGGSTTSTGAYTYNYMYGGYTFTTFAGLAPGTTDGTGSAARFFQAASVATDGNGNIYVADSNNHTIRKITPGGMVTTFAGTAGVSGSSDGTGSLAQFYFPYGVTTDSSGNVYVLDAGNNTIRRISPAGVVTTFAGTPGNGGSADGTGGAASFYSPEGITIDGSGSIYVADTFNNTIRKITPAGVVTTFAGTPGVTGSADGTGPAAQFNRPRGIATDGGGNVYVADSLNDTIRKITPAGAVTTIAGFAGFPGSADGTGSAASFSLPFGVTTDGSGNVYVADYLNHTIRKITPARVVTTFAGTAALFGSTDGTASAARFYNPYGLAADNGGNLYVADSSNSTIRKITPSATVTTFAGLASPGSTDGTGSASRFNNPTGVATDTAGNVYVADSASGTIRKITPAGTVSTIAGTAGVRGSANGTGSAAQFYQPLGLATDSGGNVYVADTYNNTIRKITPAGVVSTFAGAAGLSGSADGNGAAARFNSPSGVATDSSGNVYVADQGNSTIRKITPAGVVSTFAGAAGVTGSSDGQGPAARFEYPSGVATDSSGYIYVADTYNNNRIRKITPSGVVSTLPGFFNATAVAIDSGGNVYVPDPLNGIRRITPSGVVSTVASAGSAGPFYRLAGVAIDSSGIIYVTDSIANTILRSAAPLITNISPSSGPAAGGQSVTVTGKNLNAATVTIGGNSVPVTGTATSATFTTPSHAAAVVDVMVTTSVGGSNLSTGSYTYVAAPTIATINPNAGPIAGGQSITITGTNLSGATVTIGGNSAIVTGTTATTATFTAPAHAAAVVDVLVTTEGGSATSTGGYTYAGIPTITNINPNNGPAAGAQSVTLTGTNLSGASVTIGGNSAIVTGTTATTATFTTPAHAAGAVDVAATTAGGSATATGGYTYLAVFGTPANLVATAITSGSVRISWNGVSGATYYEVVRKSAGVPNEIATLDTTFFDNNVAAGTSYLYQVRAVRTANGIPDYSAYSASDLATTVIFTDDPIVPGITQIKPVHITELRTAVNAVRALTTTLGAFSFLDTSLTGQRVKAIHFIELRSALDEARRALALPTVTYSRVLSGQVTTIREIDLREIRNSVK